MARIEITDDTGIRGTLIDGHFPEFSFFQELNRDGALYDMFPNGSFPIDADRLYHFKKAYGKYLKPGGKEPTSDHVRLNAYKKMVEGVQANYCAKNQESCVQKIFPARPSIRSDKFIYRRDKKFGDYGILESFTRKITREILKAELDVNEYYFFNMVLLDTSQDKECPAIERCLTNCMESLNFQIRNEDDYLNFGEYKSAAEELLSKYIKAANSNDWFCDPKDWPEKT
jgi:hypothetical protein